MCYKESWNVQEMVNILSIIRSSVQDGRSNLTNDVVEMVDCLYMDILETVEVE